MKKIKGFMLAVAVAAIASSCSSTLYTSSGSAYDDLYAAHDRTAIANRQQAEAEARKAEAEARRAKYEAEQAELEAKIAALQATAKANATHVDSDGVIIVDDDYAAMQGNNYTNFVADDYESAYARRLRGFNSITYRMPSSYFDLRYGSNYNLAISYDPAFYNVMVSGDQVWVEPKYITSMFGSWGATNVTFALQSPWYYGWSRFYDPWYYSSWGFPHYSWYDWNWSICYGPSWGFGLSWGWGGYYRPWRPYHYHWGHYHGSHWGHHHFDGGPFWGGYGGPLNRGGSIYGSRGNGSRVTGNSNYRGHSMVNRGSSHATPYRSPNSGTVYNSRAGKVGSAIEQNKNSVGRGQSRPSRNLNTSERNSNINRNSYNSNNNRNSSYNSNSNSNRGSSFSSGSSGGGASRGGGGYSGGGGGARSAGSRGR